jgi:two-component system sensor histidine kinase CpxA
MRSLYVRVLVASFVTVVISLGAFMVVGDRVFGQVFRSFVDAIYAMEFDDAVDAYTHGGRAALEARLTRLDERLHDTHHFTDAAGRDLITGADYSHLLALAPDGEPRMSDGQFVFVRSSPDGRYHLIVTGTPAFTIWSFAPFYLLVFGSIVVISWWVGRSIVLPLRAVTHAAERFGRGDLGVRVETRRRGNEIGRLAAAFNDMAARTETLLQAERRLLQDVSHELRSPLARLNFSTELARTAADRGPAIDRIQADLDRLSAVVTELIEMTRAEGDPASRRREPVDLDALLEEIRGACARDAAAQSVQITIAGKAARPLAADRELLRWGIENVVRNAVRYAPPGTAVEITVATRLGEVEVSVRDFGRGVPDEALSRVFEPFFRVEEARTPASGGMGLGLAIARRAVLVHRGAITASAAAPGLRVTIVLPFE